MVSQSYFICFVNNQCGSPIEQLDNPFTDRVVIKLATGTVKGPCWTCDNSSLSPKEVFYWLLFTIPRRLLQFLFYCVLSSFESSGPEVIKLFSCSTHLSMKFVLLINLKLLTIAYSFLLNIAEHEIFSVNKYENANNSWHFRIY